MSDLDRDRPGTREVDAPWRPLVHVGYHKTASSWLQASIFRCEALGFTSPWTRPEILDRFVLVPPFRFDAARTRSLFEAGFAEARGRSLVAVLSHERLSGNPHSGGYDANAVARRLAETLHDACVLIVIREQKSMIVSCYKQYVFDGGVQSIRHYLHPPRTGPARIPYFRHAFFEYDGLIERYQRLFGPERVLVLPFEELRRDGPGFVRRIASFSGALGPGTPENVAANVSLSAFGTRLKRPMNLFFVRDALNPLGRLEGPMSREVVRRAVAALDRLAPRGLREAGDRRLGERVAAVVGDRYRESNRKTRALTGIELERYGYDL